MTRKQNIINAFKYGWEKRCHQTRNSDVLVLILEKSILDDNWMVRESVTRNPSATTQMLERLTFDVKFDIRCRIIRHRNVSTQILKELTFDDAEYLRELAQTKLDERRNND